MVVRAKVPLPEVVAKGDCCDEIGMSLIDRQRKAGE
jgi:hypothetical protein